MDEAVVTKGLTKIYKEGSVEVTAVSSVDIELKEGEVVGLFGPSGSGKTTLLSLIGCILRATRGSLRIYGEEITALDEMRLPEIRKKFISFIFQGFNLFPALTAYENIKIVLKIKGITGGHAKERAEGLLTKVGLSDRMHFLPRDLSGGQKQRVAIARALATDSPIILADEPTGNLDFSNGRTVTEILKGLAKEQKRCVVICTHDNRIADVFDRILFMEDGQVARETKIW